MGTQKWVTTGPKLSLVVAPTAFSSVFFVFIFVFDSCFSRCSFLFFCSLPLVFLFVFVLSFPYPCVFVLLSVSCVREDSDVSVGPLGFFIVFVFVFAPCTVFVFALISLRFLCFLVNFPLEVLGFLLPCIEKIAPQPVLPLQDYYGIHERDRGQETGS